MRQSPKYTDTDYEQLNSRFMFVITIFAVLAAYALFDKFILDPKSMEQQRKFLKEDYEDHLAELEERYKGQLASMRERVVKTDEQELFKLKIKVGELERKLSRVERERDAAKTLATEQKMAADTARAKLNSVETLKLKAESEARLANQKLQTYKKTGDTLVLRYKALLEQRKVLFDGVCAQLVKLRKSAPKEVPRSYTDKINRVIRRIRAAEAIKPTELLNPK